MIDDDFASATEVDEIINTAKVAQAQRQVSDLTTGNRVLRDQLRVALDDVDGMHTQRETVAAHHIHRVGELMAEITQLKADLGTVKAETIAPDVATLLKERAESAREYTNLHTAFVTERRRADAAVAAMVEQAERLDAEVTNGGVAAEIQEKALDAARAADEAFEEAKWKEANRYMKLANMWTGLLSVVASLGAAEEMK